MNYKLTNLTGQFLRINWRGANGSILSQELFPYEIGKVCTFPSAEEFERFKKQNDPLIDSYFVIGETSNRAAEKAAAVMEKDAKTAAADNLSAINNGLHEQARRKGAEIRITQNRE